MKASKRLANTKEWNLKQGDFFSRLIDIENDFKSIMILGKDFADLADMLDRLPTFEEFENYISINK